MFLLYTIIEAAEDIPEMLCGDRYIMERNEVTT